MTLTLICCVVVLLFAAVGYYRGLQRILALLLSFLLAGYLAKPFSSMTLWLVELSDKVPMTLVPLTAQICTGLIFFFLFSSLTNKVITNHETGREQLNQPRLVPWEQSGGAIIGMAWGAFLVLFTLTGLHVAGSLQEALFFKTSTHETSTDESTLSRFFLPATLEKLTQQIETSVVGELVVEIDPVDEQVQKIFQNITTVVATPQLHERFKNHPTIAAVAQIPSIQRLAQDPTIQYQIQNGQFYALLDNPQIAILLEDDDLYNQLKEINIGQILEDVIKNGSRN